MLRVKKPIGSIPDIQNGIRYNPIGKVPLPRKIDEIANDNKKD